LAASGDREAAAALLAANVPRLLGAFAYPHPECVRAVSLAIALHEAHGDRDSARGYRAALDKLTAGR
jgi:hypothetical protein